VCDTLVAVGDATADGSVILAKNSDREPNEAHVLTHIPRAWHEPGSTVECTYVGIPQVRETYEMLLSRPFWLWGCEMGVNEFGVAIGNEAVFTKEPYSKDPGLIGMDFIRLALERADTARGALDVIVTLLETYGQGGNCGYQHDLYYHNAFIIADPREAWVLETAGAFWAAERVRGTRSISNGLTIGSEWDLASPALVEHAVDRGWCKSTDDFHFARCYSDRIYTPLNGCRIRHRRSTELLQDQVGSITPQMMMGFLRDHGSQAEDDPSWDPSQGLLMSTLCVHVGFGPTRPSQSTAAMVAHLTADKPTCWLTGTSATCTGVFKPVYLNGGGLPYLGPKPSGSYDPESLWWKHEGLHRAVIRDYPTRMLLYEKERDALEAAFLTEANGLRETSREGRTHRSGASLHHSRLAEFTASCFRRAGEATERWTEAVSEAAIRHPPSMLFRTTWNRFNRQADFTWQKQG
jgi:dipeptidase